VSKSAMSLVVPHAGDVPEPCRGGIREAVLAGPGVVAGLDERARSSLLERGVGSGARCGPGWRHASTSTHAGGCSPVK
jgi:hypothetical protein